MVIIAKMPTYFQRPENALKRANGQSAFGTTAVHAMSPLDCGTVQYASVVLCTCLDFAPQKFPYVAFRTESCIKQ